VSSRTYLSIGDVLTLLREEFPDVTISKIRFLESQGLVNPERSPSGYRKFFETDVERLRWVLRQQREHFLPLKVIRDRLADGDLSEGEAEHEPAAAVTHINGRVPEPAHAGSPGGGSVRPGGLGPGRGGSRSGGGNRAPVTPGPDQTQADDEAMARILADASRRAARVPDPIGERGLLHAVPDPGAPAPPGSSVSAVPAVPAPAPAPAPGPAVAASTHSVPAAAPTPAPAATPVVTEREASAPRPPPAAAPAAAPAASAPRPGTAEATRDSAPQDDQPHADLAPAQVPAKGGRAQAPARPSAAGASPAPEARAPEPAPAPPNATAGKPSAASDKRAAAMGSQTSPSIAGMVTGASLTAEELCAASGLSEVELAGLQGFGLLEPVLVAGIPTYDEDDLTVANLAAEFRKFGIEARHLRPYRNAVDREVGLIEQVIIPLLRQRNPESRQRAIDAADELGALGQTMRATLMRTALRRHVGG
jgi:DNA-binding transcriptional MerR regulator